MGKKKKKNKKKKKKKNHGTDKVTGSVLRWT